MARVQHQHGNAPDHLNGVHSGQTQDSETFQRQYNLQPAFDIECIACCWNYLVDQREYGRCIGLQMVMFGNNAPYTSCYVKVSRRHNPLVKTGHDLNLGVPGKKLLQQNHTYQVYTRNGQQPTALALGANLTARIEAIAVSEISAGKLQGCSFNYCNAALLELYLQKERRGSLVGRCGSAAPQPEQGQPTQGPPSSLPADIVDDLSEIFSKTTVKPK